ncbi:hypothetical protein L345_11345, partial [Ophiophagus hannah]
MGGGKKPLVGLSPNMWSSSLESDALKHFEKFARFVAVPFPEWLLHPFRLEFCGGDLGHFRVQFFPSASSAEASFVAVHVETRSRVLFRARLKLFCSIRDRKGRQNSLKHLLNVAQGDTKMQAGHDIRVLLVNANQSPNNDENLDGSPADNESCYHNEHHAGNTAQIAETDILQAENHQPVADGDDQDGNQESKDKNTDLGNRIPVNLRFRKLKETDCNATCIKGRRG